MVTLQITLNSAGAEPDRQVQQEELGQPFSSSSATGLQPVRGDKRLWLGTFSQCAQGCSGSEAGWHGMACVLAIKLSIPPAI